MLLSLLKLELLELPPDISVKTHPVEFTPTKSSPRGTLLYIANDLSYKSLNDLNIY